MVISGSSSAFVADSVAQSISLPAGPSSTSSGSSETGTHWIQGQFVGVKAGTPWKIQHIDGTTRSGVVDADGNTAKVTALKPGTATITFGNKPKLEAQLKQQRAKLKASLDQILAKARAQKQADDAALAQKTWWETCYTYGKGFASSAATGAEGVGDSAVHMVKAMYESRGQVIAFSAEMTEAMAGSPIAEQQLNAQINQKVQVVTAKLKAGFGVLETFAENYYHAQSGLMILKDIGTFAGGMIPAILQKRDAFSSF